MSIERHADLSGTLMSPDQAKVSSEVAGIVREVPVQLGTEVRAGDVLVRLEPRELALALERADSALKQVEAQLGLSRSDSEQVPPDDQVATVRQAMANRDDAKNAYDRAEQLNSRGLVSKVDRDTADTRLKVMDANYQAALDNVRALRATLQDRRASYDLAVKKLNDAVIRGAGCRFGVGAAGAARRIHPREHASRHDRADEPAEAPHVDSGEIRRDDPSGTGSEVCGRGVSAIGHSTASVAYVSPAVDQATRTFAIESLVDNPDRVLKPGFFAKGTIALKVDDNVMVVPDDTVSTLAGVSTVYVIEDGKARQQIVTPRFARRQAVGDRRGSQGQ